MAILVNSPHNSSPQIPSAPKTSLGQSHVIFDVASIRQGWDAGDLSLAAWTISGHVLGDAEPSRLIVLNGDYENRPDPVAALAAARGESAKWKTFAFHRAVKWLDCFAENWTSCEALVEDAIEAEGGSRYV